MRLEVLQNLTTPHFDTGPQSISAVKVLRISLTDRCNFRCVYCMPADGVEWLPKDEILTFEEIIEIIQAASAVHGIRRFKLTGGEPTVRRGLVDLVELISRQCRPEDLSLTTNGALMDDLAGPLRQAGLHRLTISIDSLHPERFRRITRTGDLPAVLRGLARAQQVGFESIKINVVAMRGINDDELADFAALTLNQAITVRFIEYMPLGDSALTRTTLPFQANKASDGRVEYSTRIDSSETGPAGGCGAQDRGDVFIPESEIRSRIEERLGPLLPVSRELEPGVGPAVPYRLADAGARGRVAFISAMSSPFCSTCNRLRLTATGILRSCLFEGGEVDLKPVLRGRAKSRQADIAASMEQCVKLKPSVHSAHGNQQMSRLGG